ncbi:MAG: DUF2970 domain-containing protein [Pelosinus sp.]|nr:DUF2970 domain-containing protein [Pelosinus sp.]
MARSMGKRAYHREDMRKLNRTALIIGGVVAAVILLLMIGSLVM